MLDVNGLKVFHGHAQALRGVTFHARKGEIVAVLGANGAGKSTLLGALSGIYNAKAGEVVFNGKPINRRTSGYIVKQGLILVPEHRQIFNTLTVQDNLLLGAFHRYNKDKSILYEDMERVLETFPALQGKEQQTAGILSGGLQQMLAIGRGLMANPKLLMLDEPSIGLAPMVVAEIMTALRKLREDGTSIILVEQNAAAAFKVADRAIVIERGQVVISGKPGELVNDERVQQAYLGRTRDQAGTVAMAL
ncbi:MAG: ABC transporter ATP-binding protein [Desulfitobacteriaceae bacterium]|nr:ABC transporter ATP-binding protein [Desulfitobacteriaceae bacterium]MDD4345535.1 ABC transporter ATP-binding protein [Desulfitobacteriaceae bacterium]MDD4401656.1 ABC transporter ATP-binding protein [Desulfitobacteriaceae bacterium]